MPERSCLIMTQRVEKMLQFNTIKNILDMKLVQNLALALNCQFFFIFRDKKSGHQRKTGTGNDKLIYTVPQAPQILV